MGKQGLSVHVSIGRIVVILVSMDITNIVSPTHQSEVGVSRKERHKGVEGAQKPS